MRGKDLAHALAGFQEGSLVACALAFLHELSARETVGQPPRGARWERIAEHSDSEVGGALDRACAACLECWPQQLEGFFDGLRFAEEQPHALRRAMKAIERLASSGSGPFGRRTLLADVYQKLRGLGAKQWLGAFFTPWNVAETMARMLLALEEASELWVYEPSVGGGVMLLAALEVYRERFGVRASRAMTMIGVDLDARVCQIARASLLIAGSDPRQFWIFAGDALAQPVVGRDRRDGELRVLDFHVALGNPPYGKATSIADLQERARRGPLVVPDSVLYRHIPDPSRVAGGRSARRIVQGATPALELVTAAAEPQGVQAALRPAREPKAAGEEPSPFGQLSLPFAA